MDIIQALVKFQDSITDEIDDIKFREIGSLNPNKQLLIKFKNGLEISIIQGKYTYGGDFGLFEIAIFNRERGRLTQRFLISKIKATTLSGILNRSESIITSIK